jgi:hypothetical protein
MSSFADIVQGLEKAGTSKSRKRMRATVKNKTEAMKLVRKNFPSGTKSVVIRLDTQGRPVVTIREDASGSTREAVKLGE